jgi:hypothetical protein
MKVGVIDKGGVDWGAELAGDIGRSGGSVTSR